MMIHNPGLKQGISYAHGQQQWDRVMAGSAELDLSATVGNQKEKKRRVSHDSHAEKLGVVSHVFYDHE